MFWQSPAVGALGVFGIFGSHVLYFVALKLGPPAEANLLNYLYPGFIILFAAMLLGERIKWFHMVGVAMGFLGAAILIMGVESKSWSEVPAPVLGLLAGFGSALTWGLYSALSRKHKDVPSDIVPGFCLITALLALPLHLMFETTVMPNTEEMMALMVLGLGPTGAVFVVWDHGCKHGDIRVLSSLMFLLPLLSSLLLIGAGVRGFDLYLLLSCLLIIAGSMFASYEMFTKKRPAIAQASDASPMPIVQTASRGQPAQVQPVMQKETRP